MMTETATVANKIFWIKNASKLPFLRTATVATYTRSGKIAAPNGFDVYGYELLSEDAVRNPNKKFDRTVYYILEGDRSLLSEPSNAVYADELNGRGRKSTVKKAAAVAPKSK